jgi:hypothetical protein
MVETIEPSFKKVTRQASTCILGDSLTVHVRELETLEVLLNGSLNTEPRPAALFRE